MLSSCSMRIAIRPVSRRLFPMSSQSGGGILTRSFSPSATRLGDLPYHIVVGMPALSPTMETGVLAEWYIHEGSSFAAGEAIAKIETDKASIDFEAQDDGYVAKLLMEAGTGVDIKVGTPIMVTVEEEGDVPAFQNYAAPAVEVTAVAPTPPPAPAASAPSTPSAAPVSTPAPVMPAPVPVAVPVPPPTMDALMTAVAPVMSTGWGEFAKINSPLLKTLSKQQKDYINKYGTTGQLPL